LLDHLKIERAAVVGLSVGGLIAQGLAALHPERVAALVLSDTAHRLGTRESWEDRIDMVSRQGLAPLVDAIHRLPPAQRETLRAATGIVGQLTQDLARDKRPVQASR